MTHTAKTLQALSLKEIAAIAGVPSLVKCSKAKAVERCLAELATKKPSRTSGTNKHARLLEALRARTCDRAQLMKASGFDDRNLSVALCNLKRAGHVVRTELASGDDGVVRLYSIR
jgi:hypothetical protein